MPQKLFISYSHKDESFLEELHKHLKQLKRDKHISVWYDREIMAGEDLDDQIVWSQTNSVHLI